MSTRLRLDAITFDAGTQIRAALDPHVVTDYAEAMTEGAVFPPIVVFHDGNQHYLADGFHRFMAAQRNGFVDIDAEVKPGAHADALWFALGANKANGKRLTGDDKRHAIKLAVQAWPERSGAQIATQVGCSSQYVLQIKSGITTTFDRIVTATGQVRMASTSAAEKARAEAIELLRQGVSPVDIRKRLRMGRDTILELRRSLGIGVDKSRGAVGERRERMRAMAGDGHSSIQIAAALGIGVETCRGTLRAEQIDVPADRVTGKSKHLNANRILEQIVADAENLTVGANLIDFSAIDLERLGTWIDSLVASKKALGSFIHRLIKEQQKHGEAA